jgi:hypothetical protein
LEGQKHRLVKTLWRLSAKTFIPAGFCQLATVLCQVSVPLLVRELLKALDANPGQDVVREGMPFAVGFSWPLSATLRHIIGIAIWLQRRVLSCGLQ